MLVGVGPLSTLVRMVSEEVREAKDDVNGPTKEQGKVSGWPASAGLWGGRGDSKRGHGGDG